MIKKKIKKDWRIYLIFSFMVLIGIGVLVYASFNKKEDVKKVINSKNILSEEYKTVSITSRIEELTLQKELQNITVDKESIKLSLEAKRAQYVQNIQENTAVYSEYSELNPQTVLTEDDFVMLCTLVMAEAEDQNPDAQYYVACVVLNRVKSPLFPNTIKEVIYQKGQFTCVWNGRYNSIDLSGSSDEFYHNVERALIYNELPSDVLYFTSSHYLSGTVPYMEVDDMNFSSQK